MATPVRKVPFAATLVPALVLIGLAAGESAAQYPAPVERPGRSLGREFFDELFYPVRAIPEAFQPTPRRVVMRPTLDGGTQAVAVPPTPVRPLYLSGYAGARATPADCSRHSTRCPLPRPRDTARSWSQPRITFIVDWREAATLAYMNRRR